MIIAFINNCVFLSIGVAIMNGVPNTDPVPPPSEESIGLNLLLNDAVANLNGTLPSPHTTDVIMSGALGDASTPQSPMPSEEDTKRRYSCVGKLLYEYFACLKTEIPGPEEDEAILEYSRTAFKKCAPLLKWLVLRMQYVRQIKPKKGFPEDFCYTYSVTLYSLAPHICEEWYILLRDWKVGDDAVTTILKHLFSVMHRYFIWRILCKVDYTLPFDKIIKSTSRIPGPADKTYFGPNEFIKTPPPPGTIYIPAEVLKDFCSTHTVAMGHNDISTRYGIQWRSDFFKTVRPTYGDKTDTCRQLELFVANNKKVTFVVETKKWVTTNADYTTTSIWNLFKPEQQKEVVEKWVSLDPTLRTEKKLVDMMREIFLMKIYGHK